MTLFQAENFIAASARPLSWKIECDALTVDDWDCIAQQGSRMLSPFGEVVSVPTGGDALAAAFAPYVTTGPTLVVDDVWTTGASMRGRAENLGPWIGFVAFARGHLPANVQALFAVNPACQS